MTPSQRLIDARIAQRNRRAKREPDLKPGLVEHRHPDGTVTSNADGEIDDLMQAEYDANFTQPE